MAKNEELESLKISVKEKAIKEAEEKKLNEEQSKLYVKTAVEEAVKKYKEDTSKNDADNEERKTAKEIKYIVHTPVKNFCGEVAGVQFAYGKAEVKPGWILNWFKEHGYRVEKVSE